MARIRGDMNWLRLESRIRRALKESETIPESDGKSLQKLVVRIDTIMASETGRGYSISESSRESMAGTNLQEIEDEEWLPK